MSKDERAADGDLRAARLGDALRANLARRKAQARARTASGEQAATGEQAASGEAAKAADNGADDAPESEAARKAEGDAP